MKKGSIVFVLILLLASVSAAQDKLNLDDCINIALKNNTQIINAEMQLNIAKSNRLASWGGILPTLNFSANPYSGRYRAQSIYEDFVVVGTDSTGNVIREKRIVTNPENTTYSYSFQVNYNHDVWNNGRNIRQIQRGNSAVNSSNFNMLNTAVTTIQTVKQRYYELLRAIEQKDVFDQSLELAQNQLNTAEVQYSVGTVPQNDVLRSQSSVGQARISLLNHELTIENARHQLNLALGREIDEIIEIDKATDLSVNYNVNLSNLLQNAYQHNPNLFRLEEDIKGAGLDLKIAKSYRYPSLSYYVAYSRTNSEFNQLYKNFDQNYNIFFGASLNFTIFDGFQIRDNVQRTANTLEINEANFEDGKRILQSNIKSAYLSLVSFDEQIKIGETMVEAAQENYRLQDERYRIGSGTLLEMIDARSQLASARFTLVQLRYNAKIAESQLEAAVGSMDQKYMDMIGKK